jgi:uncharacterized protein YoaH (UPF0181 family)
MHEGKNAMDRVVVGALKLARTGKFEDVAAIERELMSAGLSQSEALALNAPAIRLMIDGACDRQLQLNGRSGHVSDG